MPGREEATVKVSYFDFPIQDSFTKIIGFSTPITIRIRTFWDIDDNFNSPVFPEVPWMSTQLIRTYDLNLRRLHSPQDVMNQFKMILGRLGMYQDPTDTAEEVRQFPLKFISDISYDSSLNKHVFTFEDPGASSRPALPLSAGQPVAPRQIQISIGGTQTGRAAQLLAAIFGGEVRQPTDTDNRTWWTEFDTGLTNFFFELYPFTGDDQSAKLQWFQSIDVSSMRPVRMFSDPYVYLRGTTQQSVWTSDGQSTTLIALIPRNKAPNDTPADSAQMRMQSIPIKSGISGLRNMNLQLTDAEGALMLIDEDYLICLEIDFAQ